MFEPKFDTEEFETEKKQLLDNITQSLTNASAMAEVAYRKLLYGSNHIMGLPTNGTTETVNNITLEDVKNYYKNLNAKNRY